MEMDDISRETNRENSSNENESEQVDREPNPGNPIYEGLEIKQFILRFIKCTIVLIYVPTSFDTTPY